MQYRSLVYARRAYYRVKYLREFRTWSLQSRYHAESLGVYNRLYYGTIQLFLQNGIRLKLRKWYFLIHFQLDWNLKIEGNQNSTISEIQANWTENAYIKFSLGNKGAANILLQIEYDAFRRTGMLNEIPTEAVKPNFAYDKNWHNFRYIVSHGKLLKLISCHFFILHF